MTRQMRAVRIYQTGSIDNEFSGLRLDRLPIPEPERGEVLIKVAVCGVCHTEIDEIENRSPPSSLPMTPGHQVVGTVTAQGTGCRLDLLGKRVGVAWIHSACGRCNLCRRGLENLCSHFLACGRDRPGGYAEFITAPEEFVHEIPESLADLVAAPLLCAGAVGYRSLRLAELQDGEPLGLTGFGASGHLILQMARHLVPRSRIHVFARSLREREFALELGAHWAGDTLDTPPILLQAVIDTTPAWLPVLSALQVLAPGGRLIINAIRKETGDREVLTSLNYEQHLWREKTIKSVANVTRADVRSMLELATRVPLVPAVTQFSLERANEALLAIKAGHVKGAFVLRVNSGETGT